MHALRRSCLSSTRRLVRHDRAGRHRFRPWTEALENRTVLSETWTGAVSGDWFDKANWDPKQVPGPADDVDLSEGSVFVSDTVVVGSLKLGEHASLALKATMTVTGKFTSDGGELAAIGYFDQFGAIIYTGEMDVQGGVVLEGPEMTLGEGVTLDNQGSGTWFGEALLGDDPPNFQSNPVPLPRFINDKNASLTASGARAHRWLRARGH